MFDVVLTTKEIKDDGTILATLDNKAYTVKLGQRKEVYEQTFTRVENLGVSVENGKPKAKKKRNQSRI